MIRFKFKLTQLHKYYKIYIILHKVLQNKLKLTLNFN